MPKFGKELGEEEFLLSRNHSHINHGSYGTVPKKVFQARVKLMEEFENSPDEYFRWSRRRYWKENIEAAADFLGSKPDNIALVINATYGINCVMKSLPLKKGDGILIYTWTYKAIANVCKSVAQATGAELFTVDIQLPIRNIQEDIINKYRKMLLQHPEIKVAVLESINSVTGAMYPVDDLVKLCKEHDVLVMLDGAHAPGQLDINLEEMGDKGVDFFVGNFHKWCYAARGCAALWVHPRHHKVVHPALTSGIYLRDTFQDEFFVQGTCDDTPFFTLKTALDFYKEMGGMDAIVGYSSKLLDEAVALLTEAWGTEASPVPVEMHAPNMRLIRVPDCKEHTFVETQNKYGDLPALQWTGYSRFHVTTLFVFVAGKPYARLSANIYNDLEDYKKLAEMIQTMRKEVNTL